MVIQVSLLDIMLFLVYALGIAAVTLLLPILWNVKKVVGILLPLVETNQESINKTMITMPGIIENVGQISSNLKETTSVLKVSLPAILQEAEYVTNAAKGSIEMAGVVMENLGSGFNETAATYGKDTYDFVAYFHIIEEVLQIIYRTFSSGK
jgi:hypothetical protein